MGAYRCSSCGINYSIPKCPACGGDVWWGVSLTPSDDNEREEAIREKVKDTEWAEPIDKTVNWRFEQLVTAGYDLAKAEELAGNRHIDVRKACELAQEHGAEAAYLRFF